MNWNWLKVMVNPLKTVEHINALQAENQRLQRELENVRAETDHLNVSVMTSRETALIQARQIDALTKEIAKRDAQLNELNERIRITGEEQMEYNELDALITRFEEEKKDYEKRINTLRLQLKDAREALRLSRKPEIDELLEPVDMTAAALTVKPSSDLDTPDDRKPSADWLQQLPENL